MSSKRCRITFRSGDLISLVDEATFDDEASVAKKTRHGKHTRATILRTFLVRRRYWTSLPCVVIPKRILAYGSASRSRQSQRTQLVSTWPSPGGAATAMTDCAVLRIEKNAMMQALHREHTFSDLFVAYLLERNIRYEEDLVDQLFNSSEKRLARILLLLAHFGKEGVPETVVPKISQETLSEMIGTTRSQVSFFMNRFRKLGFIH